MGALDTNYFRKKLTLISRDLSHYTPQEMARELARLAKVADETEAVKEAPSAPVAPIDERAAFEFYMSQDGAWPKAVERAGQGYRLMNAQSAWTVWKARAALSVQAVPEVTDEEIDRIAGCNGLYRAMTPDDATCKSMVRRFTKDVFAATNRATSPSAVEKMLVTNELDELGEEVARLQRALCFWLPSVTDREDEVALRILEDAFLLVGIDGNIPDDFKSAQELGWVTLAAAPTPPTTGEA